MPSTILADLSFEELASIEITSVSKKLERLSGAPASVFVITNDDIRHSGSTTLPEALRLAPNLQVARVDARNYAITARGFNNAFENKLLVLIDGRIVYTPLFSGVFWDAQDVILEDIDRIEVISGPGATLWGANAVNGVINIITRAAKDTQGTLVAIGGSQQEHSGALRHGRELENGGHYRVYAKHADNDDTYRTSGASDFDGWSRDQAGFRTDWTNRTDAYTVQGDGYQGKLHQAGTADIQIAGMNLLGKLNRKLADGSDINLLSYIDHTDRNQPGAFIERLDTINAEFQHALQLASIHHVVWGSGYRLALDRLDNGSKSGFLPASLNMHWANVFAQDEIDLQKDLRLTLGLKLEHNNYTGLEFLPNLRLAWEPANNRLIWGSLSRAVRAPSRIDRDLFAPTAPVVINGTPHYAIAGGPNFASEVAKVAEIGYRDQPAPSISYSATAFYASYDKLRTLEPGANGLDAVFSNLAEGTTHGVEMWGQWQAAPSLRLTGGLVSQRIQVKLKPGSADTSGASSLANNDPDQYWMLRGSYAISENHDLDVIVRKVGALPKPVVPAYTSMDLRFGWKIRPDTELSIVGQNLLNSSHAEFGADPTRPAFQRSVFFKMTWRI